MGWVARGQPEGDEAVLPAQVHLHMHSITHLLVAQYDRAVHGPLPPDVITVQVISSITPSVVGIGPAAAAALSNAWTEQIEPTPRWHRHCDCPIPAGLTRIKQGLRASRSERKRAQYLTRKPPQDSEQAEGSRGRFAVSPASHRC